MPPKNAAQRSRLDKAASSAVVLALTATGLLLAFGRPSSTGVSGYAAVTWWRIGLQLGLSVLGLVLLVVGLVVYVRSGSWPSRSTRPLTVLNRSQRRLVMRQLRGQQPVGADPQQLMVLTATAVSLSRPWRSVLMLCGMVVNVAGQAVGSPRFLALTVVWVIALALCALASLWLLRDQAAAERFLSQRRWPRDAGGAEPGLRQ